MNVPEPRCQTTVTDALHPVEWPQKKASEAWGDCNMRSLAKGTIIQLERKVVMLVF